MCQYKYLDKSLQKFTKKIDFCIIYCNTYFKGERIVNYQKITCQATGKELKADQIYKIRNNEVLENTVSICYNCPYAHSKLSACKNCYGTIVQNSVRQTNGKPGRIKMECTNYRNTFFESNGEYIECLEADNYLSNIDIIANLNNLNWNHGQKIADHLRAYTYPKTAKTDCANCKHRCAKNGELSACQKAKLFCEQNGINVSTASSKLLAELELPNECICKEQTQQMIEV